MSSCTLHSCWVFLSGGLHEQYYRSGACHDRSCILRPWCFGVQQIFIFGEVFPQYSLYVSRRRGKKASVTHLYSGRRGMLFPSIWWGIGDILLLPSGKKTQWAELFFFLCCWLSVAPYSRYCFGMTILKTFIPLTLGRIFISQLESSRVTGK